MKLFLAGGLCAAALGATALCGATQALAQPGQLAAQVQPGHALRQQLDALEQRIREGIRSGEIDRGEADRAMRQVTSIRQEQERLRAAGGGQLSELDRGRLQERLDNLSRSIHWMRQHGPTAGPAYAPPAVGGPPAAGGDWPLERRESWLQERINAGRANGTLSRREAYRAQTMLNDIKFSQARLMRYGHGRLRDDDRDRLNQRLSRLSDMLRGERPPWAR